MLVTLAGIVTLASLGQATNIELPIELTPLARVTLARLEQDENAESPMLVTLPGITMLVRPVQP